MQSQMNAWSQRLRTRVTRYIGGLLAAALGICHCASARGFLFGAVTGVISIPENQTSRLVAARKIGLNTLRADAAWKYVETTKGIYRIPPAWDQFVDRANRQGIQVDLVLDYGNRLYGRGGKPRSPQSIAAFVRYATFVVKHFLGRVRYYEIWNEWDTHTGGAPAGDATGYSRLFNAVYPALKRIDPRATFMVTSSSSDPGYERFYQTLAQDGVLSRADAVAFHPYDLEEPNYRKVIGARGPEVSIQRVIALEAMMRQRTGRATVPIYITEVGWPTNRGRFGFPEHDVAAMAERMALMASALPYVRGIWWYNLRDSCRDSYNDECRFGLTSPDLSFKPAAYAVQSVASVVRRDNLVFDPRSDLQSGLVVLDRNNDTGHARIAWYVGTERQGFGNTEGHYAVRCDPQLSIVRTTLRASALFEPITAVPTEFSYGRPACTRRPLGNLVSTHGGKP